jgi:hypothetical protein
MPIQYFDIRKWNEQPWFSTGGTRDKKYVQGSDSEFYYFKTSLHKTNKDYKYEFWSEVMASQIGLMYGFNMLEYHVAYDGSKVGCISKSMFTPNDEELNEGGKYIQAYLPSFDPSLKEYRKLYSFQLIEKTLQHFKYDKYIDNIIEIIVFDALIGNSDRHQENWAFITKLTILSNSIAQIGIRAKNKEIDISSSFINRWFRKMYLNKEANDLNIDAKSMRLHLNKDPLFSPIYDSGSSLGREWVELKVESMLHNHQELEAYINRGESEIHWNNEKVKFFKMIEYLSQDKHASKLQSVLKRLKEKHNVDSIKNILLHIDDCVPPELQWCKMPLNRKELLIKMVTLRFEKLMLYLA